MTIFGNMNPILGFVAPIADSFEALVTDHLAFPVPMPMSKAEFMALPKEERNKRKRTGYFVPFSRKASTEVARDNNAPESVALIALDIDSDEDAERVLKIGPQVLLEGFGACVYHTATSSDIWPRIRVIVKAGESVAVSDYPKAVAWLADKLGVAVTAESNRVVQPMYFPCQFDGVDPVVYSARGGAVTGPMIARTAARSGTEGKAPASADDTGLEFIRPRLAGVSVEKIQEMLDHISPACARQQWVEIGAALKHQLGEEGFEVWNEWSARSDKYPGEDEIAKQWDSLRVVATGNRPSVTLRTVLHYATANGYEPTSASKILCDSTAATIRAFSGSPDKALHDGVRTIAVEAGGLLHTEIDFLVRLLSKRVKDLGGVSASVTVLTKDIKAIANRLLRSDLLEGKRREKAGDETKIPDWARGLAYVASSDEFFRRSSGEKYSRASFDSTYNRYFVPEGSSDMSPSIRPQDFVLNKLQIPTAIDYRYDPREPGAIISSGGSKFLNLYVPSYPDEDEEGAQEAGKILTGHMERLIKEPGYRMIILDWLTFIVQCPGEKISWAVLIQGAPGCGKSVLGHLMGKVLGADNILPLSPEVLASGSGFNDWVTGRQLVMLEEIRLAGESRHTIMNQLKPVITNEVISLHRKRHDVVSVQNVTNYMLLTNFHDALAIDDSDRRYFVVESAMQTKASVAALNADYWRSIWGIKGGALRSWFLNRTISPDFDPHGHAPDTVYRQGMVDLGRPELQTAIMNLVATAEHALINEFFISPEAARACLNLMAMPTRIRPVHTCLRELGYKYAGFKIEYNGVIHDIWRNEARAVSWSLEMVKAYVETLA